MNFRLCCAATAASRPRPAAQQARLMIVANGKKSLSWTLAAGRNNVPCKFINFYHAAKCSLWCGRIFCLHSHGAVIICLICLRSIFSFFFFRVRGHVCTAFVKEPLAAASRRHPCSVWMSLTRARRWPCMADLMVARPSPGCRDQTRRAGCHKVALQTRVPLL